VQTRSFGADAQVVGLARGGVDQEVVRSMGVMACAKHYRAWSYDDPIPTKSPIVTDPLLPLQAEARVCGAVQAGVASVMPAFDAYPDGIRADRRRHLKADSRLPPSVHRLHRTGSNDAFNYGWRDRCGAGVFASVAAVNAGLWTCCSIRRIGPVWCASSSMSTLIGRTMRSSV